MAGGSQRREALRGAAKKDPQPSSEKGGVTEGLCRVHWSFYSNGRLKAQPLTRSIKNPHYRHSRRKVLWSPWATADDLVSKDLPILDTWCECYHTARVVWQLCFQAFLLPFIFKVHSCGRELVCVSALLLFIYWMVFHHIDHLHLAWFIHSSFGEHLGYFNIEATLNNPAMNICVQVFTYTYIFVSLGYIPRSGTAKSHGNSVFGILKNCPTTFHSGYTIYVAATVFCGSSFAAFSPTRSSALSSRPLQWAWSDSSLWF